MDKQDSLVSEIGHRFPNLLPALQTPACVCSIYKQMGVLSDYVGEKLESGEVSEARKALHFANRLYESGSNGVKNAVENVLVYSFSRTTSGGRQLLKAILPAALLSVYVKQLMHGDC